MYLISQKYQFINLFKFRFLVKKLLTGLVGLNGVIAKVNAISDYEKEIENVMEQIQNVKVNGFNQGKGYKSDFVHYVKDYFEKLNTSWG